MATHLYDNSSVAETQEYAESICPKSSNERNCESISTKRILNASTSSQANNENNVLKNLRLKNSEKVITGHVN